MASLVYLQVESHNYIIKKKSYPFTYIYPYAAAHFRKSKERQRDRKALKRITESHLTSHTQKKSVHDVALQKKP